MPFAAETLHAMAKAGAKLILWTMRSDLDSVIIGSPAETDAAHYLSQAAQWFADRDIPLYGIRAFARTYGSASQKYVKHLRRALLCHQE